MFSVLVLVLVLSGTAPAHSFTLAAAFLPSNRNCILFAFFFQHLQNRPHHVPSETPAGLSPSSLGASSQLLLIISTSSLCSLSPRWRHPTFSPPNTLAFPFYPFSFLMTNCSVYEVHSVKIPGWFLSPDGTSTGRAGRLLCLIFSHCIPNECLL